VLPCSDQRGAPPAARCTPASLSLSLAATQDGGRNVQGRQQASGAGYGVSNWACVADLPSYSSPPARGQGWFFNWEHADAVGCRGRAEGDGVRPLVRLLLHADPLLQEHGVTALLNLSICDGNKAAIAAVGAVRPLTR